MRQRWKSSSWFQGVLYLAVSGGAMLALLLPMGLSPDAWVMPDLLLALSFAWVIRRPDMLPFYLIGLVGLLADILLNRPVGQWALFLMLGAEFMRQQSAMIREYPFVVELLWVAAVFAVMLVVQRMLFFVTLVPNLPVSDLLRYYVTTVVSYPLVVAVLHWGLGVRPRRQGSAMRGIGHMT